MHEVGHALGFCLVGDRRHVMYSTAPRSCSTAVLSAEERHHGAIVYQPLRR